MSDQQEQPASITMSTPGEWLRQERERQGRSVSQIAGDLHIGAYMIDAIENNQFSVLGAPVFARGHLRKYAVLLGLPVERIQELYQQLSDRPRDQDPVPVMHRDTEPSIPMSPDSQQRRTLQPTRRTFAIAGGALVFAGTVAWLLYVNSKPSVQTSDQEPAAVQSEALATAPTQVETAVIQSGGTTIAATNKPDASAVQPTAARQTGPQSSATTATTGAPVARGKLRLRFNFNQESWVEVYDARGTRMLYDVGFAGQTRGVDVDPPAQIVLGQATAVSTEANGREVVVPSRRIANHVARFTVGADGAAQ